MKIGISPNYLKNDIFDFIVSLVEKLKNAEIEFVFGDSVLKIKNSDKDFWKPFQVFKEEELSENCDIIVSIGGDGTLLQVAYNSRFTKTPLLGVNFGKLGYLAEFETGKIDGLINYLKKGNLIIEKRNALDAACVSEDCKQLYAINDIVIDRGKYPKMIEITIEIDNEYVSTFSADGIIIATPTGSTGYSLSTGGPIVNPQTEAITLSPISAHTLSMRPLVISSNQTVVIKATSLFKDVQVICDGQRVSFLNSPATIKISKSKNDLRLVHNIDKHYFEILRKKLYWGLDLRSVNNNAIGGK
ncbi:MAG: NAD(+)/NADH kinase [Ignavibacteriales bacterium]|nr:NAD(+)/NADH kinase [Ignavibacteriales bacterium]MCB9218475.1 NAD(+)/NADH kinase [Ignavibacteriales bacterium]